MTFDPDTIAKIIGPLLSLLLGAVVKHYAEARAKVVSFIGHVSSFTLQDQQYSVVHAHSIVVRNAGRKAAHNVRLVHAVLPPNVTVYPPIQYTIESNPEGASEIVIPVLVPKEQVTISYLYFPPLTWNQVNVHTKSDEGFAKILNVIPTPQLNKVILTLIFTLIFVGASFVFYWLVRLIAYVI
ncbi:MAG: hypothetical protein LBI48_03165 [Burkholderiaceae bacterium]|nr:hypothetical protein [Burkholderiaceae bacterium]